MAFNLKSRHLLSLAHHSTEEIEFLVRLAARLKEAKYSGVERPMLEGRNIALIFEKASTRTRCAFEVAAHDQGAHVTYLGPSGSHIGHKESMKDTARVLGRMYDGIEYRGFHQSVVEELAEYAGVPVFNGLTDEFHPHSDARRCLDDAGARSQALPSDQVRLRRRWSKQHGSFSFVVGCQARYGRQDWGSGGSAA